MVSAPDLALEGGGKGGGRGGTEMSDPGNGVAASVYL